MGVRGREDITGLYRLESYLGLLKLVIVFILWRSLIAKHWDIEEVQTQEIIKIAQYC